MRFILLLPFLFLALSSCSTLKPIPADRLEEAKKFYKVSSTGDLVYVKVFEVPGVDQKTLYRRAEEFITHAYVDAESVIDSRSLSEGYLICRGVFDVPVAVLGEVSTVYASYIMKLETKDGKARMVLNLPGRGNYHPFSSTDPRGPDFQDHHYGRAFYYSHRGAVGLVQDLNHALINGNSEEPADW